MLRIENYLLFVVITLCSAASVFAGELNEDCESAVDAADRLGSDVNKECDYSNTGLNGVLHRAVAKKEKSVVDKSSNAETIAETSSKNVKTIVGSTPSDNATTSAVKPLFRMISAEFGTAQQLANARYELIRKVSQECTAGFALNKESYLSTENALLKLQITYSCL